MVNLLFSLMLSTVLGDIVVFLQLLDWTGLNSHLPICFYDTKGLGIFMDTCLQGIYENIDF